MKIAIVYNRISQRVINLFGMPNREKYGLKSIRRITDALKQNGHQVAAFEGDKDLIDKLEEFMPRVVKHERPGMVFNLSYGIQGQARYTHVPGMLEMIGLPYVGSGPLAHSLALDKVVSKMIFVQHGLPTPEFAVLDEPGFEMPALEFPLIVKPKNEAVSFGIRITNNEQELREAADVIFNEFRQPVLVEQFIAGREINVGLLGNSPTEALPPAEILFGESGPQIYTLEDKKRESGREIGVACPADLSPELADRAQQIARDAFRVLGCYDCARVDMRLDADGNLYILEVNSLPSLGEHGSYVQGAQAVGLDFAGLVNRLVDVATTRYFGTPSPPDVAPESSSDDRIVSFLTGRRDQIEKDVRKWTRLRSRTEDAVGLRDVATHLSDEMKSLGLEPVDDLTDDRNVWTWATPAGLDGGTLLVGHLDVPMTPEIASQMFRREPEWLFGEGIGSSRAPLVSMLYALKALKRVKRLRSLPLGVTYYADEGRDCRDSSATIRKAAALATDMLVLRPGNVGDSFVNARRGQDRYRITFEGTALRIGKRMTRPELLPRVFERLQKCGELTSRGDRVGVSTLDVKTTHLPMLLPHHVTATLLATYPNEGIAETLEQQIREIVTQDGKGMSVRFEVQSRRPPLKERKANTALAKSLEAIAGEWEIPLKKESSVWPSVAGLAPPETAVVCGVGPVARELYTPGESVDRISLMQRTLLLAEFLNRQGS